MHRFRVNTHLVDADQQTPVQERSRNVGLCVFPTGLVDRNGTLPFDRLPGFTGYRRAFGSCGYYTGRHAPSEKGRRVGGSLHER